MNDLWAQGIRRTSLRSFSRWKAIWWKASQNIVHRDIKGANVCLDARGRVKVLDFGLAKRLLGAEDAASWRTSSLANTKSGTLLATPTYIMSWSPLLPRLS